MPANSETPSIDGTSHLSPRAWERQIVTGLARRYARADGSSTPRLSHFRWARRTFRRQQRLNREHAGLHLTNQETNPTAG